MDQGSALSLRDPLSSEPEPADPVVTGFGWSGSENNDPLPFLKVRKSRKFMGVQDELAVTAAGRALESAGLLGKSLGARLGVYLAVGYIPFEQEDIDRLMDSSMEPAGLSMRRFSTDGFQSANPLLTFRCLCNMPAFHISVNFDVQGPYFVSYPGPGQFYTALEEALAALAEGRIDAALVGGVAHQRNFLVGHHFNRLLPSVPSDRLRDAAGCLVLESPNAAAARQARARGRLLDCRVSYRPHDPLVETLEAKERFDGGTALDGEYGPASLAVALGRAGRGTLRHELESRDGISARSAWEIHES